ncbi:MAG: hypothetical protein HKN44_05685 [Ilumatobacter sp.]|nr:hypothetical protein [Ilumatobacter sp.]
MRLGIDLDGVVAAFNDGWTELHNAEFGGELHPDMVTMWNGLHTLAGFESMGEFWAWARGNGERPSVFRHLQLLPDAIETLQRLDGARHRIVIITSKPRWAIPDTLRWLADHEVPTTEVHFVDRKHEVPCDAYLDDSPLVLPDLVTHRPDALVCRFVRAWNDPVDGAHDVAGWNEFERLVSDFAVTRGDDAQ